MTSASDKATTAAEAHSCTNCEGINPDSFFMSATPMPESCPGCGCEEHVGFCGDCGCLDNRTEQEKRSRARVQHSGPDTEFCALCLSGEHERVTGKMSPDSLPQWLFQRFSTAPVWDGPTAPAWNDLTEGDQSYWERQANAVRRAVERDGFKTPAVTEESK